MKKKNIDLGIFVTHTHRGTKEIHFGDQHFYLPDMLQRGKSRGGLQACSSAPTHLNLAEKDRLTLSGKAQRNIKLKPGLSGNQTSTERGQTWTLTTA